MGQPKRKLTELEQLRATWYKKLEAEGFTDIEQDEDNLKVWSSDFANQKFLKNWETKAAYYSAAQEFLNNFQFETELDKVIWTYHSEGISIRSIAKLLNQMNINMDRNAVFLVLRKLSKEQAGYSKYTKPKRNCKHVIIRKKGTNA